MSGLAMKQRGSLSARGRNVGMGGVEQGDGVRAMCKIRERFPGIVFTKRISPMNKIIGFSTNIFEIFDEINRIFDLAIDYNLGGRRKRLILRRVRGRGIRSEKSFVENWMKMRPRSG